MNTSWQCSPNGHFGNPQHHMHICSRWWCNIVYHVMSNDNDIVSYITRVATLSNQVTYLIQHILEVPCWTRMCVDTTYQHIIISIQTTVNRLQLCNNLQKRPSKVDSDSYTQWSCTLPKNWSLYNGTRFTSYTCSCVIHRVNIYWSHSLGPPSYSSLGSLMQSWVWPSNEARYIQMCTLSEHGTICVSGGECYRTKFANFQLFVKKCSKILLQ